MNEDECCVFLEWSDGNRRKRGRDNADGNRTWRVERHAKGLGGRETPPIHMPGGTAAAPPQKHMNESDCCVFLDWSNSNPRKRGRANAEGNGMRCAKRNAQGLGGRKTPPVHMPGGTADAPPQKHMNEVKSCVFLDWSNGDCRKRGHDDVDGDGTRRADRHAQGPGGHATSPVHMPGGAAIAPPQKHMIELDYCVFLDWSNSDQGKCGRGDANGNRTRRAEQHAQV